MQHSELAREIVKIAHLTGHFLLRSGKTSHEYFDKYRFEAQPRLLAEIAKQMVPLLPKGIEALAGLEMGGIPIATALSLITGLPIVFVRKEAKEYGTKQFAEGLNVEGKRLCIIEDVITTGGQVLASTADLRGLGAIVSDVLCVIHRGESSLETFKKDDLTVTALFTKKDLTGQ